jgi:PAS domain S-box-containing protein
MTPSGEVESVNQPVLKYFGKTFEELKRWGTSDAVHPEDLSNAIAVWKEAIETGQPYDVKERLRRFDGVYRWFDVRGFPLRDPDGRILNWCVLLTDIDDRKRAEEALRQSEQRWRTAFENSAISIMLRDLEGRYIAANSVFQNMLGYTESELCQLNFLDVTHEEDCKAELQLVGEILEGKRQHYQIEKRYRRKDGALFWVRNNVALVPGMRDAPFLFAVVEDITQRMQEESARRYSEERHRVVVETANDAVVSVDESGAIQFANPATMGVFGYDPQELIGKPLTVLMPEFMRKLHENGFRRYLATGQRHINWQGTELTGLRKNGQEFPVEVSFGETVTESGRTFTGFIRDVSARKRAEEKLRHSEQRWRAVFENSAIGVALTDMTGRFVATNSAYQEMLGYSEEELNKQIFLELTLEDDRKRNWALVAELVEGKRSQFQIEKRYRRKDGRLIWVSNNVSLVPGTEDVPRFVMALSEDVTGRKQAEDTFRLIVAGTAPTTGSDFFQSLVQHMAQALRARYALVTTCDDQKRAHTLAFWKGDGFGENFEFDIADTPCEKVLHGEVCHYREGLQGLFPLDKLLADWQAESYIGVPMLDRSNRAIGHIAILDSKPMDADLRTIDLLKIFASRAVAELKRQKAEDQLQAALQERLRMREELAHLAHLNRVSTMGELTASLAHEINQPIGAAVTNAQACLRFLNREQPDVPGACEAALEMVRDATRAVDIIDRVRSMYRKGSPHLEMVDINEVILEMVVMLRNEANRNSVRMHTELDETAPQVMADRVQLQQGLMNLMMNGIEAMRDSGGELSIKSQLDEEGELRISISDTGVGLPAGKETEIFNTFFTTKSEGTGLGLAITRTIVESHGGRVWATNNTLRGTTFQFTLPSKRAVHA